jgi:hypothetical protein
MSNNNSSFLFFYNYILNLVKNDVFKDVENIIKNETNKNNRTFLSVKHDNFLLKKNTFQPRLNRLN